LISESIEVIEDCQSASSDLGASKAMGVGYAITTKEVERSQIVKSNFVA